MKKGLGSIPKSLAWIDSENPFEEQLDEKVEESQSLESERNASQEGLQYGWTRATFIIKQEYARRIKAYAYWERVTVKDIMDELLREFFKEKKIKGIPQKNIK